jgi:stage V sporulation protein D (sporulation-specific penicillin-binding protein)
LTGPGLIIRKRMFILLITFSIFLAAMLLRVAYIQIVQGGWFQKKAYEQQTQDLIINAKRGTIFDRNGKALAVSASVETVIANPQEIRDSKIPPEKISKELAGILGMDGEKVKAILTKKSRYELVKKRIDKELGDQVRKWIKDYRYKGLYVFEDNKRFYPDRNLASHVLGFTGSDNQGLNGIELVMDRFLKGVPGKVLSEVDARGRAVPFTSEKYIEPVNGLNVVLTVDESIQYFAEKAIEGAIVDNKCINGAAAIVMDPRTGEILAMASKPDFDPNAPFAIPKDYDQTKWNDLNSAQRAEILSSTVWRNKAVNDTYEPGSTFKAVTSAAGLQEGVIKPDSMVTDATVTVGGRKMNCWKPNAHGSETFTEGVYNSCNPVFVRVALDLGVSRFYKYVKAFGFFDKTGLILPGEQQSIFHKKPTEVDMAVASFGQRFQITPIQLINAYAAVANGGNLMKPQIVKELTDSEGNIVKKFEPEVVRNVISKQTSDSLKKILEGVVSEGTGSYAYVKGFRIAGKTGTSQTTDDKRYIASFSAFAPADDPVICALVILDYPTTYPHTGGMIAAPVAGKLCDDILNYLGVEKKYTEKDKEMLAKEVQVPVVKGKTLNEARKLLKDAELEYRVEGNETDGKAIVMEQTPMGGIVVNQKSVVILYMYKPQQEVMVKMPDLLNKSLDEAKQTLGDLGLNISVFGTGSVINQEYDIGEEVPKGDIVSIELGEYGAE